MLIALMSLAAGLSACGPTSSSRSDATLPAREADRWFGVDRAETFRAHVARVASIAVAPDAGLARLGTTWAAELAAVERRYVEASSRDDVRLALQALANSLHNGHVFVRAEALQGTESPVVAAITVRVEYEGNSVRYVVRAGGALPEGSQVLAVDGVAVESLERAHLAWFRGGNSREALREDLARWVGLRTPQHEPSPRPGERLTVRVRAAGGAETDFTLVWSTVLDDGPSCPPYAERCAPDADGDYVASPTFEALGACVYATDDPQVRVVRYRSLWMPDARDPVERACLDRKLGALSYRLRADDAARMGPRALLQRDQGELLDHLARAGVRRVLFDVRENRGGDFDPVFFGAFTAGRYAQPLKRFVYGSFFREDPARVLDANVFVGLLDGEPLAEGAAAIASFLRENPSSAASPPVPFYCQTRACRESEATLQSLSNVVFRAAVLTGPQCFSACDDFVAMFRLNAIAPTLGLPTGAGDAPYTFDAPLPLADGTAATMHLATGVSFLPGAESTPLEAHPAPVDVPLPPSSGTRGRYLREALARVPW